MTRRRTGFSNLARVLVLTLLAHAIPLPATAGWRQAGIDWLAWPSGSNVGDCFGNCGAGCGRSWNICGGPHQYWDLEFIAGPNLAQSGTESRCVEGVIHLRTWEEFHAIGTWTYHGWVAPLCIAHDVTCNAWRVGCLWVAPCGEPRWRDTWSYDQWMRGYASGDWEYTGEAC